MVVKRLLDGRFQFIRVVSSKNYSKTYLMVDQSDPEQAKCIVKHLRLPTRNPVTLKFLSDLLSKRVNLLKRLGNHKFIAQHLASIQDGRDFYWIREYVSGQPLSIEIADGKPASEEEARSFLVEALTILDYIQQKGVVHQNLHPNNLIRHKADGHLVIVDFGLAQETGAAQPLPEVNNLSFEANGHSAYLPQVRHRQYPRFNVDHFALGMITLQLATGLSTEALPQLQQTNFLEQIKLQLDECSTLGEPLKDILLRMVSPHTEAQFHRAKDILTLLQLPTETPIQVSLDEELPLQAEASLPPVMASNPSSPISSLTQGWRNTPAPKVWLGLGAAALLLMGGLLLWRTPQNSEISQLIQKSQEAKQAGRQAEAIGFLDQALQLAPKDGDALAQRATLLWENGELERALQDLTNAIQADPTSPTWYFQRGNLRLQVGDLQGAIADYTASLEQDDSYGDAYVNRGNARADLGDEAGAIQDYTTAITAVGEADTKADAYLNRCLSRSNLGDHASALNDCTEAINLRPNNSLAYENRGLVKRRLNDPSGALQDFTIAIQINPGSAEPYYNRALVRQELGDLTGALEDFDQTISLNPDHPFVYYDRGLLYADLGEREQAIADLEKVTSACLDVGRIGCFEDAQYQLRKLREPEL
ncbi:MAG: tetratricopeptide repeat protein [Leptolyngbyaceae cyanobacterium SM2_3_12]|nr:tetratricopeptide repeat protein [Leptolyngbyaceae cyanobacterium SM2_3_12]